MKRFKQLSILLFSVTLIHLTGCSSKPPKPKEQPADVKPEPAEPVKAAPKPPAKKRVVIPFNPKNLSNAALERTRHKVKYDGRYVELRYPMGDVPNNIGVCTDVVVRAYRRLGIDLQKNVHEDMRRRFYAYPSNKIYGKLEADSNIDHRRVVNLEKFFQLHGKKLPVTRNPDDYLPGDLVTYRMDGVAPHIGIVVDKRSKDGKRPLVVHNDGKGPVIEDILFDFPVLTGHYRYWPARSYFK